VRVAGSRKRLSMAVSGVVCLADTPWLPPHFSMNAADWVRVVVPALGYGGHQVKFAGFLYTSLDTC
jgi:hypothetical protein